MLGRIKTDPMWKEKQDELEGMSNDQLREIDEGITVERAKGIQDSQTARNNASTDLMIQELLERRSTAGARQTMAGAQAEQAELAVQGAKDSKERASKFDQAILELTKTPEFQEELGLLGKLAEQGASIPAETILQMLEPKFKPELSTLPDGTTAMTTSRKSAVPVSRPKDSEPEKPVTQTLKIGGKTYTVGPGNRYFDEQGNPVQFGGGSGGGGYDLGGMLQGRFGGEQKELTEQDKQAIEWARANPSDPRAVEILKRHGL